VFAAWATLPDPTIGYRTSELIAAAMAIPDPALREALLAVAASHSNPLIIDPKRLGRWLLRNVDTVAAGRKLTVDRSDISRPYWKLEAWKPNVQDPPP
jgi:hypothetical protein